MKQGDKCLFVFPTMGSVGRGKFVEEKNGTIAVDVGRDDITYDRFLINNFLVFPDTSEGRKAICGELSKRIQYAIFDLRKYGGYDGTD